MTAAPRTAGPVIHVARRLALLGAPAALLACASAGVGGAGAGPGPREARAELRRAIDSMVAASEFRSAHWGILIVDPATRDTLYSRNAGKLFMPASNMKVVTGAVALALLGSEFRFRTTFAGAGPVTNGVLDGDLVIHGRGDPTLSDRMRGDAMLAMREIADSLAAKGITRIRGALVPGEDVFPDAPHGFGWSWDDLSEPYSAGVDELIFNEGFGTVVVRAGPDSLGSRTIETRPIRSHPVLVSPHDPASAVADGVPPAPRDSSAAPVVSPDPKTGALRVAGRLPSGDSLVRQLAYPDQRSAYVAALKQALAERGILVEERGRSGPASRPDTLFVTLSLPLRDILPAFLKPSQNQIGEVLLKTLGLERTGVGTADSGRRVVERQLAAWGAEPDGFVVRDGSGLSRYNYLSPETLVRTLDAIRRDTAFAAFYDGLPIAGVDGTIARRMQGTAAQGNARAKTGFVAQARSLSGYVTSADGRTVIFSLLCNNWTVPVRAVEQVQDAIVARLAGMRLGGVRP